MHRLRRWQRGWDGVGCGIKPDASCRYDQKENRVDQRNRSVAWEDLYMACRYIMAGLDGSDALDGVRIQCKTGFYTVYRIRESETGGGKSKIYCLVDRGM